MYDSFTQDVRWLLKDKFSWTEESIQAAITQSIYPEEVQKDITRLKSGEPLAYVIGWVPFLGMKIDLTYKTLIPRPETEYWVEHFLKTHQKIKDKKVQVLDLCCGSGCIGLAVLKHWPASKVDFVDVEQRAIKQTQKNLDLQHIESDRWQVIHSDLFNSVVDQYDFILTNPPYVDPFGEFSPSIYQEPKESLFAQKNGIELIEKIIINSKKHLKTEGEMWLEFGETQADEVKKLGQKAGYNVEIYTDQFGRDRYANFT